MQKDNVIPIKSQELSLEKVKEALNSWRSSKKRANEGIPIFLWQKIFGLLGEHTETEIRSVLRLTPAQLERGSALLDEAERLNQEGMLPSSNKHAIDFCEVQEKASYPLAYKPAEAFATNTCVVELYRPDGMLMKIHICTDRFDELLRAFFKGWFEWLLLPQPIKFILPVSRWTLDSVLMGMRHDAAPSYNLIHSVGIALFFEIKDEQPSKYCSTMVAVFGFATKGCPKGSLSNGHLRAVP